MEQDKICQNYSNVKTIKRLLAPFIEEILPEGGIDMRKSMWQKPGRGYGGVFQDHPDVRYVAASVKLLYDVYKLTGEEYYHELANKQVRFIARFATAKEPMWLLGTALQAIGMYSRFNPSDNELIEAVYRITGWARSHKVMIDTGTVTYGHFPCGYGCMNAKDSAWTND